MTEKDAEAVLNSLIEALTSTPQEYTYSTTVDFKLIPFQRNVIKGGKFTQLITRQNNFLHISMATSVVDGGYCRQYSIAAICLDAQAKDRMYLFDAVEPGRKNQCHFMHPNHIQEEAETFLDTVFDHFLKGYGEAFGR